MQLAYVNGVRLGRVTVDPTAPVEAAFWTHRPARRVAAAKTLASQPLAAAWRDALGLPLERGAIALGGRLELLPTGYGPGGAALLLTQAGQRLLVVGPTTEALLPRRADRLVLAAPGRPVVAADWLDQVRAGAVSRLVVPDGAAGLRVVDALARAGVRFTCPRWLGRGHRRAPLRVSTRGPGLVVDLRPQADEDWLVRFALSVRPGLACVHGPRAEALAAQLAAHGVPARVMGRPTQLSLAGIGGEAPAFELEGLPGDEAGGDD